MCEAPCECEDRTNRYSLNCDRSHKPPCSLVHTPVSLGPVPGYGGRKPGWPHGPGGYRPHCSNDLFQRQDFRSQVLQRLHISLEYGVQDNISDSSITYPMNKYSLSIYDALAAALVQSVRAVTEHCPGCCFSISPLLTCSI